jgi:hypothetical protein
MSEDTIAKHVPLTLAATLLASTVAGARAQTAQVHDAHHPAATQTATDAPLPG